MSTETLRSIYSNVSFFFVKQVQDSEFADSSETRRRAGHFVIIQKHSGYSAFLFQQDVTYQCNAFSNSEGRMGESILVTMLFI